LNKPRSSAEEERDATSSNTSTHVWEGSRVYAETAHITCGRGVVYVETAHGEKGRPLTWE